MAAGELRGSVRTMTAQPLLLVAHRLPYLAPDIDLARSLGVLAPTVARADPRTRRELKAGRWQRHGQVVICHNGPLSDEQAVWVAVLRSPVGVVLAGSMAAVRRGLSWPLPARPQLLVPAAGPLPHLADVDVRRTRLLEAEDVHPVAQPPQLRLPRAVVDEASRARRPDDVRALLCAAVQQRMARVADLREVVLRMGPIKHRALMLTALVDVEGGAHSVREMAFGRLLRRATLPPPSRQVVRRRAGGRYYLDAAWEDWDLHAEIDGLGHLEVAQWGVDCDRTNELELGKVRERRLRIPGFWIDERPDHVIDQVRRGLIRGGWHPSRGGDPGGM